MKTYNVTQYIKVMRESTIEVESDQQLIDYINFKKDANVIVSKVIDTVSDYDSDADLALEISGGNGSDILEFSYDNVTPEFTLEVFLSDGCNNEDIEY